MNNPVIKISPSAHGTLDVVVYDLPNTKMVDWFSLMDIWGSWGFDRFNDGGLYFELPLWCKDMLKEVPFIRSNNIKIETLGA